MKDWKKEEEHFAMLVAFNKGRQIVFENKRRKERHHHKSRGKVFDNFKKEIIELLNDSIYSDWAYNGEDEYKFDTFDEEKAANKIIRMLGEKGLLKYIK